MFFDHHHYHVHYLAFYDKSFGVSLYWLSIPVGENRCLSSETHFWQYALQLMRSQFPSRGTGVILRKNTLPKVQVSWYWFRLRFCLLLVHIWQQFHFHFSLLGHMHNENLSPTLSKWQRPSENCEQCKEASPLFQIWNVNSLNLLKSFTSCVQYSFLK